MFFILISKKLSHKFFKFLYPVNFELFSIIKIQFLSLINILFNCKNQPIYSLTKFSFNDYVACLLNIMIYKSGVISKI